MLSDSRANEMRDNYWRNQVSNETDAKGAAEEFTRRCADSECCEWVNDLEHCGQRTLPLIKCRAPGCPEWFDAQAEPCHAKLHEMLAEAERSAQAWQTAPGGISAERTAALCSGDFGEGEQRQWWPLTPMELAALLRCHSRLGAAEKRAAAGEALLRRVEWTDQLLDLDGDYCPVCNYSHGSGHVETCELAAFLAAEVTP